MVSNWHFSPVNIQSISFSHIVQLLNPLIALLLHFLHIPSFEQSIQCKIVSSQDKHLLYPYNEYLFFSHSLQISAPSLSE